MNETSAAPADAGGGRPQRGPGRPRHETPSPEYLQRREAIIETASEVFQLKGYDAGSLEDVAAALDLGKASLYYYVRSKSELLYLVFDQAITRALASLESLAATEQHPRQRIEALIRHQVGIVAGNPSLFSVFFDQRPRLERAHEAEIQTKERRYLRLFAQGLEEATAAGLFPAIEPRYAAQLLLGMTNWTYKWFREGHDDEAALADAAVLLVLGP